MANSLDEKVVLHYNIGSVIYTDHVSLTLVLLSPFFCSTQKLLSSVLGTGIPDPGIFLCVAALARRGQSSLVIGSFWLALRHDCSHPPSAAPRGGWLSEVQVLIGGVGRQGLAEALESRYWCENSMASKKHPPSGSPEGGFVIRR